MAVIKGNLVSKFVDRGIEVEVFLNNEPNTQGDNQGKAAPRLLDNTSTTGVEPKFIGKAVVCQDGCHIGFQITSNKGLCGIMPKISTQQETISDGISQNIGKRYGQSRMWVDRYSWKAETIKVSDFSAYEKDEGFARSNVEIKVLEVVAFTRDGVRYPVAGAEPDVRPGSLDGGNPSSTKFGTVYDQVLGGELGAMQMRFFVLKDAHAVADFAEALQGITADDDWN